MKGESDRNQLTVEKMGKKSDGEEELQIWKRISFDTSKNSNRFNP